MAELDIKIGGRVFRVACADGEEAALQQSADLLAGEAETLKSAIGQVPESRMLLMAGLMLGDRHLDLAGQLHSARERIRALEMRAERAEAQAVMQSAEPDPEDASQMALFSEEKAQAEALLLRMAEELEALADQL